MKLIELIFSKILYELIWTTISDIIVKSKDKTILLMIFFSIDPYFSKTNRIFKFRTLSGHHKFAISPLNISRF